MMPAVRSPPLCPCSEPSRGRALHLDAEEEVRLRVMYGKKSREREICEEREQKVCAIWYEDDTLKADLVYMKRFVRKVSTRLDLNSAHKK